MGTLANSEYPDKILHNAVFHQCLHCLLRQNRTSEKEIQYFCVTPQYGPFFCFMENSIGPKRVNIRTKIDMLLCEIIQLRPNKQLYTTLTNFSTKYLMMCKVYIDVGGIK